MHMSPMRRNRSSKSVKFFFIFVQYYAADAYSIGVANIDIYSADTDVLILSLDHFDSLPEDTIFVTGKKNRGKVKYPK